MGILVGMHPIERLRYVARAGAAPDNVLVAESVPAFGAFESDPGALLVSIRQLITRRPESPALLVLGARMLLDLDPLTAGWGFVDELESDRTGLFADEVAMEEAGGVELVETVASGPGEVLCPAGADGWTATARRRGRNIIAITPVGSRLPRLLWQGYQDRNRGGLTGAPELLSMSVFDELIGPEGPQPVDSWSPDCRDVAELVSF